MAIKNFFLNIARGAGIGVAMIIPGVSGGTVAVLLNIYDKIIDAINSLRKEFKKSVLFLLPILLGAALAVCAAYFPLKYALKYAPLPTVLLFAGLMTGSLPKTLKDGIKKGFKKFNIASVLIPLAVVIGICFIPGLGDADLSADMPVYGYFLLVLIGMLGSCALVIPGVSGSMLLLIFGYYNAILNTVSALKDSFGHSLLVLALFAAGIIVGFFTIAKIMKLFLSKFPRGTTWAIIGFVIGSIPAILITFPGNFKAEIAASPLDSVQIAVGAILFIAGIIAAYAFTAYVEGKSKASRISEK